MTVSLWEFASGCYQYPGVAEVCLTLQDHADADINMLLAAAWLAIDARRWQADDVAAITQACHQWRSACLLPLRQIRRDLKRLVVADNWYQRIKTLELDAERYQLRLIEDAVQPLLSDPAGSQHSLLNDNLATYLTTLPNLSAGAYRSEVTLLTRLLGVAQQNLENKTPIKPRQ